jgi:hypothetical protein
MQEPPPPTLLVRFDLHLKHRPEHALRERPWPHANLFVPALRTQRPSMLAVAQLLRRRRHAPAHCSLLLSIQPQPTLCHESVHAGCCSLLGVTLRRQVWEWFQDFFLASRHDRPRRPLVGEQLSWLGHIPSRVQALSASGQHGCPLLHHSCVDYALMSLALCSPL